MKIIMYNTFFNDIIRYILSHIMIRYMVFEHDNNGYFRFSTKLFFPKLKAIFGAWLRTWRKRDVKLG